MTRQKSELRIKGTTGRPRGVKELMPRRTDRVKWLQEYKVSKGCADCGFNGHFAALDFDHVRGEKHFNLSLHGKKPSWKRIFEEIAKCDVVCANCHRIRTYTRGQHALPFGTMVI